MTAARIRALFPETAFRAAWSSAAFLFYAGTAVMLGAILWLLSTLNGHGDDFGLFGWSSLGLAALIVTAVLLTRAGMTVLAGLAAFLGLVVFAVWLGALEDWIGFFPDNTDNFFNNDFEIAFLVIEVLVIAAGLYALRVWRFPLLVLPVAAFIWYGITDNVSVIVQGVPGNGTHASLSIVAGLLLVAAGIWLDRSGRSPYAFWLHVVGGVTAGGGILELLDHGDWRWWLAGLIALAYVAAARVLARSSYAVIGAIGIFWVGSHFIEEWFSTPGFPFIFFEGDGDGEPLTWKGPFSYAVLGLILAVLGILLERGLRLRARGSAPTSP